MKTIKEAPETPEHLRAGRGKKILSAAILLLLIVSLFFYRNTWLEILTGLKEVEPAKILAGMLLGTGGCLFEGITISFIMGAVTPHASAGDGIRISFLCEFYRLATLGSGSGIAKIHYFHQKGIPPGIGTVLTMLQYMWKKISILVLGGAGFLLLSFHPDTRSLMTDYMAFMVYGCVGTLAVTGAFFCLIFSGRAAALMLSALDLLAKKLPSRKEKLSHLQEQIEQLHRWGKTLLKQGRRMLCVFSFQTEKLLLFYCIPACVLASRSVLGVGECIALMAAAYMLSGVIPAPSGVGSLEFVFLLFFGRFISPETALPAILVFRFATWILPFAVGGIIALAQRFPKKQ